MSQTMKDAELLGNGWTAVPRSFTKSLADVDKNKQAELSVEEAQSPGTDIAKATYAFAKEKLPEKTFNHSMRVWYYGKQSYEWLRTPYEHVQHHYTRQNRKRVDSLRLLSRIIQFADSSQDMQSCRPIFRICRLCLRHIT